MTQRRARRTREKVLRAAASEIVQSGYQGTTLVHVATQAHVTLGAVSFHFPTKQALVQEVYLDGIRRTTEAVQAATRENRHPLPALANLTQHLARLLVDDDLSVAACSRLSRDDRSGHYAWPDTWQPHVAELAHQVCNDPHTDLTYSQETLHFLVHCLLTGTETWTTHNRTSPHQALHHLATVWQQTISRVCQTNTCNY